jgi:DNA-binding NarL/FixJ family response regulator
VTERKCQVAIVDVYPLFRTGVVQLLRRDKNSLLVAEGATADDAERLVRENETDVLLLEVAVPGSLRVAQAILRAHRNVRVIFMASVEDLEHATQALHTGVHGYIMKGITGPELVKAISAVHSGERYISPGLAWRLATRPESSPTQRKDADAVDLSIRERQVLEYTQKGLTNQEIARVLGLGLSTIKYCKMIIFRKMGVRNRVEAVAAISGKAKQV